MNKFSNLYRKIPQGARHACIYGLSIALMKGVSLIMLPFIAHHVTPTQFGKLEIITSIAMLSSVLIGMGLEQTLFRFAGSESNKIKSKLIASELFGITIIISFLSFFTSWFISPLLSTFIPGELSRYNIMLILAVVSLEGCISVPLGWMRMNNNIILFFLSTTSRAIIQAILTVILILLERGISGVLEASLIATLLQSVILFISHVRSAGISLNLKTTKITLIYGVPIVGSGILSFAQNGFDRWIVVNTTSLIELAQYGIALKFGLAVVLLFQPFTMWWNPKRFSVLNSIGGKIRFANSVSIGTVILFIITPIIWMISPIIVHNMFPESYYDSSHYIIWVCVFMLVKELTELYNVGCFCGNSTKTQFYINFTSSFVAIVLMVILSKYYFVYGVIAALICSQSLRFILFYTSSQSILKIAYPIKNLLYFSLFSISLYSLRLFLDHNIISALVSVSIPIAQILYASNIGLIPRISNIDGKHPCES
ncbi:hypothetical protein A9Q81_15585 [Gammaproteobacteria bacterium 42_54_T18]|nr:hypothetical protein A9Q81_15585 [Gammaproteobacteria bacterium 42_54_T18]